MAAAPHSPVPPEAETSANLPEGPGPRQLTGLARGCARNYSQLHLRAPNLRDSLPFDITNLDTDCYEKRP